MIKKVAITVLLIVTTLNTINAEFTPGNRDALLRFTLDFLQSLQKKDINAVKRLISNKISIQLLNEDEYLKLADDMMSEKISTSQYIVKISGHNIALFCSKSYEIIKFVNSNDMGYENITNDEIIPDKLYYIKLSISYKKPDSAKTDKIIEVDLIQVNNQFKVIGFII